MSYIRSFHEVGADSVGIAGGKGANLGEMTRAGLPVPPGFCVTANVYFDYVNRTGVKGKVMNILNTLNVDDTQRLQDASKLIREVMTKTPMPPDIRDEIKEAYR